jgi:hypothetical protein
VSTSGWWIETGPLVRTSAQDSQVFFEQRERCLLASLWVLTFGERAPVGTEGPLGLYAPRGVAFALRSFLPFPRFDRLSFLLPPSSTFGSSYLPLFFTPFLSPRCSPSKFSPPSSPSRRSLPLLFLELSSLELSSLELLPPSQSVSFHPEQSLPSLGGF